MPLVIKLQHFSFNVCTNHSVGKTSYSGGSTCPKWFFPNAELRAPKFDFGTARDHQYTGLDMASAQGGEAADGEIQRAKKLTTDLQVKRSNIFFAPPNKVSYFSRIGKVSAFLSLLLLLLLLLLRRPQLVPNNNKTRQQQ